MTDRELLELAAKAAGLTFNGVTVLQNPSEMYVLTRERGRWNPLTDDGDAQCLAVKLRMTVRVEDYGTAARIGDDGARWWGCEAHLYGGTEAATRRAIVRAAAEMGKGGA